MKIWVCLQPNKQTMLKIKKIILMLCLIVSTQALNATAPSPFDRLPNEIIQKIFSYFQTRQDLSAIINVNKCFYENTKKNIDLKVLKDLECPSRALPAEILSDQDIRFYNQYVDFDKINEKVDSLQTFVINKNTITKDILTLNALYFDLTWTSLAAYLDSHQDFYQRVYEKIFEIQYDPNFRNYENESILQHLTCLYFVFAKEDCGFKDLNHKQQSSLIKALSNLYDSRTYISVLNFQENQNSNSTFFTMSDAIVTSQVQIIEPNVLRDLLAKIPNAKLILDVGTHTDEDKVLDSPTYMQRAVYLVLTNTRGNVTTLEDGFLFRAPNLEYCDLSGLPKLKVIKNHFLHDAKKLQYLAPLGIKLETIGELFLFSTPLDGESIKQELLKRN